MCGIAGFLDGRSTQPDEATSVVGGMASAVTHRGPDDAGVWVDGEVGIALAHRRLAVIDLSRAGHQPMPSATGRRVIVFNGEIYNHFDLRRAIEASSPRAPSWKGRSDTETLLAAIECWGIEEALRTAAGMFAFALWDREDRTLHLARDRAGEKPLYYGWQKGVFLFGSELKVLAAHPAFEGSIDRDALALFLRHRYIPTPWSIYKEVRKLPAGTYVKVAASVSGWRSDGWPQPRRYWSLQRAVAAGREQPFEGASGRAVDALHDLLLATVGRQMAADVPLGAFLSGGIDSSTIVALMQAQSTRPVRTFTVGFEDSVFNEADHARTIAVHLGTEHTELHVSAREALDVIPRLPDLFDEPFADPSQIPTFLVAEMARRQVTVALSGDGGDELFGGYGYYLSTPRIWRWLSRLPLPARRCGASAMAALLPVGSEGWTARLLGGLPKRQGRRWTPARMRRLMRLANCRTGEEFHWLRTSHWARPDAVVRGASEPETVLSEPANWPDASEFSERLMAIDALSYLPDDILVKVDRAAMGASLETRAPFLDHQVMQFVWRLPLRLRMRNTQSKWILRQVLYKYAPRELIDRPKMGFSVPISSWLRGPLRDWGEALLDERRLREEEFFHPRPVRRKWKEHLSEQDSWDGCLWNVLMFQAWLDHERRGSRTGLGRS